MDYPLKGNHMNEEEMRRSDKCMMENQRNIRGFDVGYDSSFCVLLCVLRLWIAGVSQHRVGAHRRFFQINIPVVGAEICWFEQG